MLLRGYSFFVLAGCVLVSAQLCPAQSMSEPPPLPIENGKINVAKLQKARDARTQEIIERIREIDAVVSKAFAEQAPKLFGITPEEFDFLRRQAEVESSALTDYFKANRRSGLNTIEEADMYFDNAYQALQAGEFWFGREESLLEKDKSLYNSMAQAIAVELAKTEEGMKILDLRSEKQELISELKDQQPIYEYLLERRRWWRYYPDYEALLNNLHGSQLEEAVR